LGNAVIEAADGVEYRAPNEHRSGDREAAVLDILLVPEGEDALECFCGRHSSRILDQDVDSSADEIRRRQLGEALFEPTWVRPAIAIDERQRLAARGPDSGVSRRSSSPFGDLDDPAARSDDLAHGLRAARTAVVSDDNFCSVARKALRAEQS